MLGNCQSKALVKLAEVVIKDWTIPFCLKVHLGKPNWVFCFGPNQAFDFELALGTSRTKSYCEKCQSWKKIGISVPRKPEKQFKFIVSKTIHCFKNNLQKWGLTENVLRGPFFAHQFGRLILLDSHYMSLYYIFLLILHMFDFFFSNFSTTSVNKLPWIAIITKLTV